MDLNVMEIEKITMLLKKLLRDRKLIDNEHGKDRDMDNLRGDAGGRWQSGKGILRTLLSK